MSSCWCVSDRRRNDALIAARAEVSGGAVSVRRVNPGVLFDQRPMQRSRGWVTQHGCSSDEGNDAIATEWLRLEALHFAAYLRGDAVPTPWAGLWR